MTLAHFLMSPSMKSVNCRGFMITGVAPCFSQDAWIAASASILLISAFSLSTTASGVPFGATRPSQIDGLVARHAGLGHGRQVGQHRGAACAGGGDAGDLAGLDQAGHRRDRVEHHVHLAADDVDAGPELPLNGTCRMSMPAICLNSSPAMWYGVPGPEEAKVSLPGLLLGQRDQLRQAS